jgi:hypothetical protein
MLITGFALLFLHLTAQNNNLKVSILGIDSIKIGMSVQEVEKSIDDTLSKFDLLDSISKSFEIFTCTYQDITFQLIFSKATEHENKVTKLLDITPITPFAKLETFGGIKTNITKNEFIQICKMNNYGYSAWYSGKFSSSYYLSLPSDTSPASFITVTFMEEKIIALGVTGNIPR